MSNKVIIGTLYSSDGLRTDSNNTGINENLLIGNIKQNTNKLHGIVDYSREPIRYKGGVTNTARVNVDNDIITVDANVNIDGIKEYIISVVEKDIIDTNKALKRIEQRFSEFISSTSGNSIESRLTSIETAITGLNTSEHTHTNKSYIDALNDNYIKEIISSEAIKAFTINITGSAITALAGDKTYSEITTAINSGYYITAKYNSKLYVLYSSLSNAYNFINIDMSSTSSTLSMLAVGQAAITYTEYKLGSELSPITTSYIDNIFG